LAQLGQQNPSLDPEELSAALERGAARAGINLIKLFTAVIHFSFICKLQSQKV
jgi:hypothetical protein